MLRDLSCDVFTDGPDVAAVLDRTGTVVAVNDAWTERARASGSERGCGVGVDYLEVCRSGAEVSAPGARRAYASVQSVLSGDRSSSSSTYPCGGPGGLRWFRSDVFAIAGGEGVCVRHIDVTAAIPVAGGAERVDDEPSDPGPGGAAGFHEGLAELMRRVRDAHLMVLVGAVPGDRPGLEDRTATLVQLAVVRAAGTAIRDSARVDLAARLNAREIAVAVSGPSLGAVVGAADGIRFVVSQHLRDLPGWGLALATDRDSDPTGLVDRARAAVGDISVVVGRPPGSDPEAVARGAALHRSARRLSDAVTEFDAALDQGLPITDLVWRDQEVAAAERGCVRAAETVARSGRPWDRALATSAAAPAPTHGSAAPTPPSTV